MYIYRGSAYQSFPVTKGNEPLFVANLNCTGNEDDIGLCKASNDISICSHDSVSVDCSSKHLLIQFHLANISITNIEINF